MESLVIPGQIEINNIDDNFENKYKQVKINKDNINIILKDLLELNFNKSDIEK